MTDSYSNLDLDVIKKQVCEFAPIQESRIFIMEEDVSFNPLAIRKASKETAEALKLLKENVPKKHKAFKLIILPLQDKSFSPRGIVQFEGYRSHRGENVQFEVFKVFGLYQMEHKP